MKTNSNKNNFNPLIGFFHVMAFLGLFLLEQIPLGLLTLTKKELGHNYASYLKIVPIITIILLVVVAFIIWRVFKKAQLFKTIPFKKSTWIIVGFATILTFAINAVTVPLMNKTNSNVDALQLVAQNNIVILILFTIIVAPILEEILFRGIFMNWFFPNTPIVSVLLSGLFFGYAHAPFSTHIDWVYFLSKVLLGIVLAAVYARTKNIKADITVHFLNNFLAIVIGAL
ncbi:CPBP family intramembrane glutamic endopeptidase [Companilactobacillus keshanensis]|uniref:CPBP family intramembrane glutamic endopeptidase n=1 Tax=Companilactobacillus keshanensis TaxID=2486003 RepID=A0ABW4BW06_9LACO|nr:type II CAAX endopeptidase family protein [Companilactobacillus keshanensis]